MPSHYTDLWGQTYTKEDFDKLSEVWVCTEHRRFLPCRECPMDKPAGEDQWHSCDENDVKAVREWQSS